MNYFMAIIGVQYLFATGLEVYRKHWAMAVVYLCYGISALALSVVKIK